MAEKPIPALDYLAQPEKHPPRPVCAVFGDEAFLRRQAILGLRAAVLGGDDGDFSLTDLRGPRHAAPRRARGAFDRGHVRRQRGWPWSKTPTILSPAIAQQLEDYVARPSPQRRAGAGSGFAAEQHAALQVDRRRGLVASIAARRRRHG